jgi:hypothetical protein
MRCEVCGVEAETRHVTFYQNIGALVVRFVSTVEGHLCKSCIHSHFWSMTLVSLLLGWWGVISFLLNPFFILNNLIRYLLCLGMKPPSRTPARDETARAAPTPRAPSHDGCYLCGRPLRPEERQSRVCRDCS